LDDKSTFLMLDLSCDQAVGWVITQLQRAGLAAMTTFDLQSARQAQVTCPCPHHGTERCDCQMVVLLVYQANHGPVAIIAHGYNQHTWFSVVDTPQQRADPYLEAIIRRVVVSPLVPSVYMQEDADAG